MNREKLAMCLAGAGALLWQGMSDDAKNLWRRVADIAIAVYGGLPEQDVP